MLSLEKAMRDVDIACPLRKTEKNLTPQMRLLSPFMQNKRDTKCQNEKLTGSGHSYTAE